MNHQTETRPTLPPPSLYSFVIRLPIDMEDRFFDVVAIVAPLLRDFDLYCDQSNGEDPYYLAPVAHRAFHPEQDRLALRVAGMLDARDPDALRAMLDRWRMTDSDAVERLERAIADRIADALMNGLGVQLEDPAMTAEKNQLARVGWMLKQLLESTGLDLFVGSLEPYGSFIPERQFSPASEAARAQAAAADVAVQKDLKEKIEAALNDPADDQQPGTMRVFHVLTKTAADASGLAGD